MEKIFWYKFYCYFYTLKNTLVQVIMDYEILAKKSEGSIDIDISTARYVYMQYIVTDVAKLIGVTKVDQFGMKKLINRLVGWKNSIKLASFDDYSEIRSFATLKQKINSQIDEIGKVLKEYNDIIEKLTVNRNSLGAHIQIEEIKCGNPPISSLKSSPKAHREVYSWLSAEKYQKIKEEQAQNISTRLNEQRYHPKDLIEDIPKFREMISQFTNIVEEINDLVYENLSDR